MYPRLRALNDDDSNSDSDDDGNKRPSKEVQEEQTIAIYNKTLLLMAGSEKEEAINAMEALLACPYLNEEEKTSSPIQNQIRLGCLKNLSTLYCEEPYKNLESAQEVLLKATQMDPKNVNLWNKLGQTARSARDYTLSHAAFIEALRCSPNHWGCIENLVTLSYVINDPKGCLQFCALGLEKDAGFLKGLVFRDHIFKLHPYLQEFSKVTFSNYETLMVGTKYEDRWKEKFLSEVGDLTQLQCDRFKGLNLLQEEKYSEVIICPIPFKEFSLVELCSIVLEVHTQCRLEGTFRRPVNLTGSTLDEVFQNVGVTEPKEDTCEPTEENNGVGRSLSVSEDKENAMSESFDETNEASANGEGDEYSGSQSQLDQSDTDGSPKKKSRKDVKWWQLEGKRRSQRVRGHMLPTVPNKPKSENGFAEMLKNIIPPSLLAEHPSVLNDREDSKASNGKTNSGESQNYFGRVAEISDVKKIIEYLGTTDIITIVVYLTEYLATNCKRRWPQELASEYLKMYTVYMSHTQRPDVNSVAEDNLDQLQSYCFVLVSMLELCTEELTMNGLELLNAEASLSAELNYLYEILTNKVITNKEIMLRLKWLQLRHSLALCQGGHRSSCTYEDVLVYLNLLKNFLSEDPELQIFIHTKSDSIISLHAVEKKLNAVNRMRSLNKINELHESENYNEVIEILKICFESEDSSSVCDSTNRFYLAEAYFHVGDLECVTHCAKAIQSCIRSRDDDKLDECIILLERICTTMNSSLTLREQRQITNIIIQILLLNEKRGNSTDTQLDTLWCILHKILYRLESEEPVLYLEEETVPNSILALQMGHEILSRTGKCTMKNGKLLLYTIDSILVAGKSPDHFYWMFEETKHVIEQAVFCLYGHPSKKAKLRYLSEHNVTGINLGMDACLHLYEYYKPTELPEFDSYDSISSEVEILIKRILAIIPEDLKPTKHFELMKEFLEETGDYVADVSTKFPDGYRDIFYLLADRNFKGKEWVQAVANYSIDVSINPNRFDSWASLALAKAEMINTRLNSCDDVTIEDLVLNCTQVLKCYLKSLRLEPTNLKIRFEFGSFAYAMHSFCSRYIKQNITTISGQRYINIENNKQHFLTYTLRCFDPELKEFHTDPKPLRLEAVPNPNSDEHDEVWMQHYMTGKVMEKGDPRTPTTFLRHYIFAAELLHKQGAPYPAKINFYNPPELAVEALEVYYRLHASILRYVENNRYNRDTEKFLLELIETADNSPFVKSKQGRSGDGSESKKRKQSVADEAANKKEVQEVLNDVLSKVETLLGSETHAQSTSSTTSNIAQSNGESSNSTLATTETESNAVATTADGTKPIDVPIILKSTPLPAPPSPGKAEEDLKLAAKSLLDILEGDINAEFPSTDWGIVVSKCVNAMQECIARFPQHHKSYFRVAKAYKVFKNDCKAAKEVFIGSATQKKKLCGLFGDRKPNNFFNGVWRNPIDDIDRPGSFPYHMSQSVNLLLEILAELNDHQLLAEIGIQLTKVPDSDKKCLITEDREKCFQKAFSSCAAASKRFLATSSLDVTDKVLAVYDTYIKLNKYSQKDNTVSEILVDAYKLYFKYYNQDPGNVSVDIATKFCQNLAWTAKTVPTLGKTFMPGKFMPTLSSIEGNQTDALNLTEAHSSVPGGLPKKKKLGLTKRQHSRSTTPGGTDVGDPSNRIMDENMILKKMKPLPQLTSHPSQHEEMDQSDDIICLDLTVDDPANGALPKTSSSVFSTTMGRPYPSVPTGSVPNKDFVYNNPATSANAGRYVSTPIFGKNTSSLISNSALSTPSQQTTYGNSPEGSGKMPHLQRQDNIAHSIASKFTNSMSNSTSMLNTPSTSKYAVGPSIFSPGLPNTTFALKFSTALTSSNNTKCSTGLSNNISTTKFPTTPKIEIGLPKAPINFIPTANSVSPSGAMQLQTTKAGMTQLLNTIAAGKSPTVLHSDSTTPTYSSYTRPSPKIQVATKSTGSPAVISRQHQNAVSPESRSPNQNGVTFNRSPFKQQPNAITSPTENYGLGSDLKSDRTVARNKVPPVAHSQGIRRLSVNSSHSPEPEVIDLTTTPTKVDDRSANQKTKRLINNSAGVNRRLPDPALRLSKRGQNEGTESAYRRINEMPAGSQTKTKIINSTKNTNLGKSPATAATATTMSPLYFSQTKSKDTTVTTLNLNPRVPKIMDTTAGPNPRVPKIMDTTAGPNPRVPKIMDTTAGPNPRVPKIMDTTAGPNPRVPKTMDTTAVPNPRVPKIMDTTAVPIPRVPKIMDTTAGPNSRVPKTVATTADYNSCLPPKKKKHPVITTRTPSPPPPRPNKDNCYSSGNDFEVITLD